MKITYFATRKELTDQLNKALAQGFKCFRIKHPCNCRPISKHPDQNLRANQRNGIIIIQDETVKAVYVRCKNCSKQQKQD